jgi:urea carboxylase
VYAENPARNFEPAPGLLQCVEWAEGDGVRVDGWVNTGTVVSPFYDPLLAKVITHAPSRSETINKMIGVLEKSKIYGAPNNVHYAAKVS